MARIVRIHAYGDASVLQLENIDVPAPAADEVQIQVKAFGLNRADDIAAVVAAGADAIGFVFYPKSPRYVTPEQAATLIAAIPPYVTTVGLFVNASVAEVQAITAVAPLALLQFHGDETPEHSAALAHAVQNRQPSRWKFELGRVVLAQGVVQFDDTVTNTHVVAKVSTLRDAGPYGIAWTLDGHYNGAPVTTGGIAGKIVKVSDAFVVIEVSDTVELKKIGRAHV